MEQTVKQRLISFIKNKGIGQGKFEKIVGLSNGYLNQLRNEPSRPKLEMIIGAFPELNKEWLLTGEGDMLKDTSTLAQPKTLDHVIKYYPNVTGSMGGVEFIDNPNEMTTDIIIPGYGDCKYAINAYGNSMSPLIQSGQIVLLSEWQENFVDWGKIYLIVTKTGYRAIKHIFPSDKEDCVICKSENEKDYPPFEVNKSDIIKMYLIHGWICRNEL